MNLEARFAMHYTVTVDEAIRKGQVLIKLPFFLAFSATIAAGFFVAARLESPVATAATIAAGWTFALLYCAQASVRWRIWAFSNVRNVYELRDVAVLVRLMSRSNSLLGRLEIASALQRRKLRELDSRFVQADDVRDSLQIGSSIVVRKWYLTRPLIEINAAGITTHQSGFVPWADVSNDLVEETGSIRYPAYSLMFEHGGKEVRVDFRRSYSPVKLLRALRIYRGRAEGVQSTR